MPPGRHVRGQASGGVKLGVVLLIVGAVGAALMFLPGTGPVRRILGTVTIAAVVAFVVQVLRALDRSGGGMGDVFDVLGVAVYVTLAGGALLASSKWPRGSAATRCAGPSPGA